MTQLLLFAPVLCCFFWIVIFLCRWRQLALPAKVATAVLFFAGVGSLIRAFTLTTFAAENTNYATDILEVFCFLTFYACLFPLADALEGKPLSKKKDWWVFLPGGVIALALCVLYLLIGEEAMATYPRELLQPLNWEKISADPLYRAYYIVYIYIYRMALIGMANITLIYAWNSRIRLFLVCALFFVLSILTWESSQQYTYGVLIVAWISWGCALFYLAYHLSRQEKPVQQTEAEPAETEPTDTDSSLTPESENWHRIREKLLPLLQQLMDEEHLFRQPNLRVDDLTRLTQTNRNYIFRLLKEEYGYGFSEYINRHRIAYAQRLAHLQSGLTQEQIAQQSGFTHSATFSRTFKQYTGTTFREWQKSNL